MTANVSPSNSVVGLTQALGSSSAPQSQSGFAQMLQEQSSGAPQNAPTAQKSPEQTSSSSGTSSTNGLPNVQQKKPTANDGQEQKAKGLQDTAAESATDDSSLDPADASAAKAKRSRSNAAEKKSEATPTNEGTAVAHMPQQGMMNLLMSATTWSASTAKALGDKAESELQAELPSVEMPRAGSGMVSDGVKVMLSAGLSKGDTQAEAGSSMQAADAKVSVDEPLVPVTRPGEGEHAAQGIPDRVMLRKSGHVEGTQRAELASGQGVDRSAAEQGRRGVDRSHTSRTSDAAGNGSIMMRQSDAVGSAATQATANLQVRGSSAEQSLTPDKSSLSVQGGAGQAKLNEMRRGVERLQTTGAAEAQLNVALSTRPTEIPLHVANLVLATPVNSPEFPKDLGAQVSLMVRDGVQHAELQVHPAELGPISIQISLDGTNARVDFSADSAVTRHVIESGLHELAAALRDAGFTLSGGGVHQQSRGPRDGDNTSGKQGGGGQSGAMDRIEGGEELRLNTRVSTGGVDLYA